MHRLPVLAGGPTESQLLPLGWGGQVGRAPDGDAALREPRLGLGLEGLLDAVHLHRRLVLAVRQVRQTLVLARDADEALDVVVPGGPAPRSGSASRPRSLAGVGLEVDRTMAVALAPPGRGPTAHVIAPDPVEPVLLGVGFWSSRTKKCLVYSVDRVVGAALHGIALPVQLVRRKLPLGYFACHGSMTAVG